MKSWRSLVPRIEKLDIPGLDGGDVDDIGVEGDHAVIRDSQSQEFGLGSFGNVDTPITDTIISNEMDKMNELYLLIDLHDVW